MDENVKKYFIKDSELTSIEQDKLSSKDIVKNIGLIIDNTKPPYSIALTGKSGIGKSSIVNLVSEQYESKPEYKVQKINVWKEEEVSLKEVLTGCEVVNTTGETETKQETKSEAVKEVKKPVKTITKIAKYIGVFAICLVITSLIFVVMEYLQNHNVYRGNDVFFIQNTYMNYKDNFGMIFIFSCGLAVIAFIINTLLQVNKKPKTTEESVALDVIENTTVNVASENKVVNSKYILDAEKTNIIIVEDVDKLTTSKMLKTIEDVKYCRENSNCIIIVPFDEKVLSKAINARNEMKLSGNYKPLKFEKVMDKLFEFKVYTPNIANENLKDYVVKMVKETIPSFIEEYCDTRKFEKIIKNVLIYKNVKTPRHAKKLVNNFINNKIVATYRAEENLIDSSLVETNTFDFQLAKMSVIQSDFSEFYKLLFRNPNYMEALTSIYCMELDELRNVYDDLDDDLKVFISTKYRPLRNFLKQTKNVEFDNITTMLYLTKVREEIMFKDKRLYDYISGAENISELRIQEVLELVKLIDGKDDLKEFTENNFEKLLEEYKTKCENKIFFMNLKEIVDITDDYIEEENYTKYLEIAAENYNYYPDEALEMFKNTKNEIPVSVMNVLFERMNQTLTQENYDKTFEFLRENNEPFFEENGNVSEYVQFLVNNIGLASNPTEVIEELDENFNRIGKVYELNKNIKGLENLNQDKAYEFIGKCINNADFDKTVSILNSILSDEDSVEGSLKIEEKMTEYKLVDVVECNVDDILDEKFEGNIILLKNLIEVASYKQEELDPTDVMKLVETALVKAENKEQTLAIYEVLKKFDRMYFYEIRRDYNEIIYADFHKAQDKKVKKAALDCTRYFKNTRLFITKLDKNEEKFYAAN